VFARICNRKDKLLIGRGKGGVWNGLHDVRGMRNQPAVFSLGRRSAKCGP